MAKRLAGRFNLTVILAVVVALLSAVDVGTKALAERLNRVREAKLSGLSLLNAWRVSAMPAMAGGKDLDPDLKGAMKSALEEVVPAVLDAKLKPISDRIDGMDAKIAATVDEKLKPFTERFEAMDKSVVRVDQDGKRFKWNGGEAPAHVRSTGASKPLLASNIFRGVMAGGPGNRAALQTFAPEELAISDRLLTAGYRTESLGAMLYPLHPALIVDPINEKGEKVGDLSALRKEIGERLELHVDPGEIGRLAKRVPGLAAALDLQEKDLAVGDDSLGAALIPASQATTIFDLFRARSTVTRAGATIVELPPSGNNTYPRLKSDPDFAWTDPDSTSDASTSNLGLGVVRLLAKALRGYVTLPNDLLRYSGGSVELLTRMILAARAAVGFDDAALQGAGSSLAPKGLINYDQSAAETPAVGKITLHVAATVHTDGDTFGPEDVAKIIGLYYTGDDPDPPTGWIMRPMHWAYIANLRADAVTVADQKGPFLFWTSRGAMGSAIPEALGGHPVYSSSKVSKTRAKGAGTTLTYAIFGNYARLLLGMSGAVEIAVSEHVKFLQDKTVLRAVLRGDTGVSHEQSFVFTDTLLNG